MLKQILKETFDYEVDTPNLYGLLSSVQAEKCKIQLETTFNSYHTSKEYSKLILIEALILREIAPKRRKRRIRHE